MEVPSLLDRTQTVQALRSLWESNPVEVRVFSTAPNSPYLQTKFLMEGELLPRTPQFWAVRAVPLIGLQSETGAIDRL